MEYNNNRLVDTKKEIGITSLMRHDHNNRYKCVVDTDYNIISKESSPSMHQTGKLKNELQGFSKKSFDLTFCEI